MSPSRYEPYPSLPFPPLLPPTPTGPTPTNGSYRPYRACAKCAASPTSRATGRQATNKGKVREPNALQRAVRRRVPNKQKMPPRQYVFCRSTFPPTIYYEETTPERSSCRSQATLLCYIINVEQRQTTSTGNPHFPDSRTV